MEKKRTLISTFYEGEAIKVAISKFSIDKLIILIDEPKKEDKRIKMNERLQILKQFCKGAIEFKTEKISSYNIPKIMEETLSIIDNVSKIGNEILVNITEGRKPTSLAVLFASYLRKDKIKASYYITEEEHNLIKLPILNFQLNETKKKILNSIKKGKNNPTKIIDVIGLKRSVVYQYIQELKEEGYIINEGELNLTDLGRIVIA